MTSATEKLLARVEGLCAKASPKPWSAHATSEYWIKDADDKVIGYLGGHPNLVNNAEFICQSRTLMEVQARMIAVARDAIKSALEPKLYVGTSSPLPDDEALDAIDAELNDALTELDRLAAEVLEGE